MSKTSKLLGVALFALLIAGCGGKDDAPADQAPAAPPAEEGALSIDAEPTAELVATDATAAADLLTQIQEAGEETAMLGQMGGTQAIPTGGSITYTCAQFLGSGATGTVSYTYPDTPPAAGWTSSITFADCSFAAGIQAYSLKGTMTYEYYRYVSGSDFGFRGRTDGLTFSYSENGTVRRSGTYKFSYTFDLHNGAIQTTYSTSKIAIRDFSVQLSGSNIILNVTGVIDLKRPAGTVRLELRNWTYDMSSGRLVAGRGSFIGAKGTRADVELSSTGYTVVYTAADGTKKTYTVTY
ncbi:MAG TPA: hypothetical protein VFR86_14655 [Burkholderiaceae bacterium]|nr:hypothetical protein [Burkholderiaceae bacterium]